MEILGSRQKKTRNPRGAPHMLLHPRSLPVALCPRPVRPRRHGGWRVRGTDAAALYFISLIRIVTANKTGWCVTAESDGFASVWMLCKLLLI